MSDILVVDVPELFLAVSQEDRFPGHVTVHKLNSFSKSCVLRADFDPVPFGMVFVVGAVVGSVPLSVHRRLSVKGCPVVIEGEGLLKLYEKLRVHREIVNMHGQVMIGLKQGLYDVRGVLKAEYIRCSDVFLWSDFGGCLPLRLWSRYVFCTDRFVDDPQLVLDGREGEEINVLRKEALELQRQLKEQKDRVVELQSQISKQQGAGVGASSSTEASIRRDVEYWQRTAMHWQEEVKKLKYSWEITEKDRLKLGSEKNRAEYEVKDLTISKNRLQYEVDQLRKRRDELITQSVKDRNSYERNVDELNGIIKRYSEKYGPYY
uniref:p37 n=1 Tax=Peanut clump virus Ni TaxID=188887 RepID=Q8B0Z2_9VIRU|nr:P37 [Peanut clump virus Ni]